MSYLKKVRSEAKGIKARIYAIIVESINKPAAQNAKKIIRKAKNGYNSADL